MTTIRLRRGTAAQWTSANPVLALGEPGFETDTGKQKIGNGTATWTALAYVLGGGGGAATTDASALTSGTLDPARLADGAVPQAKVTGLGSALAAKVDGTDARLSDQRVPTDGSVSTAKVADGAVTKAKLANAVQTSLTAADATVPAGSTPSGSVLTYTGSGLAYAQGPAQPGPAYNLLPGNFIKYRRGLARVRAGLSAGCVIVCAGDSTTGGDGNAGYDRNYPSVLTGLLNAYYIPTVNSFMGTQGVVGKYDSRITVGAGWATTQSLLMGVWFNSGASDTSSMVYRPTHSVDRFRIYYLQNGGTGSFSYSVDGAAPTTVNTAGTEGIGSVDVTGITAGNAHVLTVTKVSGAVYLGHVRAWNTSAPVVEIMNGGMNASSIGGEWGNTGAFYARAMLAKVAPDLTIIDLGINDSNGASPLPNFSTLMQNLITTAKVSGDVLLKSMIPTKAAGYIANETIYANTTLPALATSQGCGYLDGFNRWGGANYAPYDAAGYYTDTLHPSIFGYNDVAQAVFNVLRNI